MCVPWFPGIWTLFACPVQSPTTPPPLLVRSSYVATRTALLHDRSPYRFSWGDNIQHWAASCLSRAGFGRLSVGLMALVLPFITAPTHTALEASVPTADLLTSFPQLCAARAEEQLPNAGPGMWQWLKRSLLNLTEHERSWGSWCELLPCSSRRGPGVLLPRSKLSVLNPASMASHRNTGCCDISTDPSPCHLKKPPKNKKTPKNPTPLLKLRPKPWETGHWFYKQNHKSGSCLLKPDPTWGEGKVRNHCAKEPEEWTWARTYRL